MNTTAIQARHTLMVRMLAKPSGQLVEEYTPFKADLDHMAMGVGGEVGELIDAIKKHTKYNKPLDRENCIEELGDIEFYLSHLRELLDVSREETLQANIDKLAKRYPNWEYTNQAAIDRADKVAVVSNLEVITETFGVLHK